MYLLLSFIVAFFDLSLILQICVLLFVDGVRICRESCIYCSMGCSRFVVHGIAWFFYTEVADSWGSWDSIAHSCWSWGNLSIYFEFLGAAISGLILFLHLILNILTIGLFDITSAFHISPLFWVEFLCATCIRPTYFFKTLCYLFRYLQTSSRA